MCVQNEEEKSPMNVMRSKLTLVVVILFLIPPNLLESYAENFQPTAMTSNSSELSPSGMQSYRVLFVITSESDWTTLQIKSGGRILNLKLNVIEGGDAPEFRHWYDSEQQLIGMCKRQYDTTRVRLEVKVILYDIAYDMNMIFKIRKGDIKYTTVEVYNYNTEEPTLIKTVTNSYDPEIPIEFSIPTNELTSGGPLPFYLNQIAKLVWAFYYPWYYENQWYTDRSLIDKPLIGPYSSSDPEIIDVNIRQAKSAGIDGFIVSWWGQNHYTDRNLKTILKIASKYDFKITIYLESLKGAGEPRSKEELEYMLRYFFSEYGEDTRYYRVDDHPVIFVWAVDSQPLSVWKDVISKMNNEGYAAKYIAMTAQPEYLEAFDGLHIYGPTWIDDLSGLYRRLSMVCRTYCFLTETEKHFIWAATICPGYDDRMVPGRAGTYHPREEGYTYSKTFHAAIDSIPDWILITSFNEWPENTYIEPSEKYGYKYLDLTTIFASAFKNIKLLPSVIISKTVSKTSVRVGETVVVDIKITNGGNGTTVNLTCTETIPEQLELLEGETTQRFERLLPGDTISYQLKLKARASGTINLPATIVRFEDVYEETYTTESETVTVKIEEVTPWLWALPAIAVIGIIAILLRRRRRFLKLLIS